MKSILDVIGEKDAQLEKVEQIISNAEKEERKLNELESNELTEIRESIAKKDLEINQLKEDNNSILKIRNNNKSIMENKKFSLLKAINDVANNRTLDERAQAVVNEGIEEMRKAGQSYSGSIVLPVEERSSIQATLEGAGIENVSEDKLNILEPLRANMVLAQAGANFMTGLVGDVSIPVYSGNTVGWKGEIEAAGDGAGSFSEVTLTPKRLTAYVDVSKQFLIQDSNSAEDMLKRDIVNALSEKLEQTILGAEAGSNTKPAGIFNGVTADTTAVKYADVVNMEATLENANVGGNICYIVNPTAKATLKTTSKDTGSGRFLMEGGEIDGYPVYTSSAVASKGVVMGNFEDYVIAQWGGIDLVVDAVTQAVNGKVRLVVSGYFDAKPRRANAFVKKILK